MADIRLVSDSDKLELGGRTNGDLNLYHNGTNSFIENETGILYVTNKASASLILGTADTAALTIDSSQNATFSGQVVLDADNADLKLKSGGSGDAQIGFWDGSSNKAYFVWDRSDDRMELLTSLDFLIDTDTNILGAVGIGTVSPDANSNLHIEGSGYKTLLIDTSSSGGGGLIVEQGGTQASYYGTGGSSWLTGSATTDALIRAEANFIIATGGNNRAVTIDSSQNVGIGHATPQYGLTIAQGTGDANKIGWEAGDDVKRGSIHVDGSSDDMIFQVGTSNNERMRIDSSGDLNMTNTGQASLNFTTDGSSDYARITGGKSGSGTGDLKFYTYSGGIAYVGKFDYNGDFYSNDGTIHNLSDKRGKKDIQDLSDGLDIVKKLKPVTYKWNGKAEMSEDDDVTRYGFVADDILEVASQYVGITKAKFDGEDVDDYKTISMLKMFPMLVKAIQELSAKVEELENA